MCAACGDETSVPFRPTGVKPVYCRNCFHERKSKEGTESTKFRKNSRQTSQFRRSYRKTTKSTSKRGSSAKTGTKNTSNRGSSAKTVERFGDRSGPYRASKKMHKTSCRTCKKEVIVPFKPTATKSIYCQDCFQKVDKK